MHHAHPTTVQPSVRLPCIVMALSAALGCDPPSSGETGAGTDGSSSGSSSGSTDDGTGTPGDDTTGSDGLDDDTGTTTSGDTGEPCEMLPDEVDSDMTVGPGCVMMDQTHIRDGAHLQFVDGTTVYVLADGFLDAGGGFGTEARITATNTTFTSAADTPAPGDWGCIALGEASIFDSVTIEYAGAPCGVNGLAMTTGLYIDGPNERVTASILDSAGHGLIMGRDAEITGDEESAFLFNGNALPSVNTAASAVMEVGPSVFEDFDDDYILIASGGRIDGQGTLFYQNVPYVVDGHLNIGGAGVGDVEVYVEPGVEIRMLGESIEVHVDTTLTMQGVPSDPIVITSAADSPAPGDWGCVFSSFGDPFTMQYVIFEYGGGGETCDGNDFEAELARVPAGSDISECVFRDSAGAGISGGFAVCDPDWCDNTFENNAGNDIDCPGSDPDFLSC